MCLSCGAVRPGVREFHVTSAPFPREGRRQRDGRGQPAALTARSTIAVRSRVIATAPEPNFGVGIVKPVAEPLQQKSCVCSIPKVLLLFCTHSAIDLIGQRLDLSYQRARARSPDTGESAAREGPPDDRTTINQPIR